MKGLKFFGIVTVLYILHIQDDIEILADVVPHKGGVYDRLMVQPSREIVNTVNVFNNSLYNEVFAVAAPYIFIIGTKPIWPLIGGVGMLSSIVAYEIVGVLLEAGAISRNNFNNWIQNPRQSARGVYEYALNVCDEFKELRKNMASVKKWLAGEFKRRISHIRQTVKIVSRMVVRMLKDMFSGISLQRMVCMGVNKDFMKNKYITTILRSYFSCDHQTRNHFELTD